MRVNWDVNLCVSLAVVLLRRIVCADANKLKEVSLACRRMVDLKIAFRWPTGKERAGEESVSH